MAQIPSPFSPARPFLDEGQRIDAGVIARFFNVVYAWMAAGLGVTGAVAWWVSTQPQIMHAMNLGVIVVLGIVELALVFTISAAIQKIGPTVATALFLLYAALNGLTLSFIFVFYAHSMIASAFFITAGTFAAVSVYGFVTKRDLTRFGSFLFMGLIGVIIATVVSFIWHSTMLIVLINYVAVFVFIGLTAYDTQRLKAIALQTQNDPTVASRLAINGALALYLDFILLFQYLLSILNNNRD